MDVTKFFKTDGIEQYIDEELNKVADNFYSFAHGFFDLSKIGYPEKYLENAVPDEYNRNDGILKKTFEKIYKLEDKLQAIEEEARKTEEDFNSDESMVIEIKSLYQDMMQDFSKKMFMYGVKFGTRLSKKI